MGYEWIEPEENWNELKIGGSSIVGDNSISFLLKREEQMKKVEKICLSIAGETFCGSTPSEETNYIFHISTITGTPGVSFYGKRFPIPITAGESYDFTVWGVDVEGSEVKRESGTISYESTPPTLTLDTPNNQTLYEGSKINIKGTAHDPDAEDAVIVKYEIASSGEKILTTETPGGKEFSYGKVLTFTNSKIYDGSTAITKELKEDNTYTLTVWAQDDKGATSKKLTRQFTVVPNRAPILEITKTPNVEGVSKHEAFTIEGTAKDLDGDDIKITYTHNGGKEKTVKLTQGKFIIDLKLTDLKEGRNTFIVKATDDYEASTAREIRVDMKAVKSDVSHIENKIYYNLPLDKVTDGLLVWVRRPATDNTDLKGYSSITDGAEDFKVMEKTTGIFQNHNRDEFIGTSDTPGSNLKLKFEFEGEVAPIDMIQGVIK